MKYLIFTIVLVLLTNVSFAVEREDQLRAKEIVKEINAARAKQEKHWQAFTSATDQQSCIAEFNLFSSKMVVDVVRMVIKDHSKKGNEEIDCRKTVYQKIDAEKK